MKKYTEEQVATAEFWYGKDDPKWQSWRVDLPAGAAPPVTDALTRERRIERARQLGWLIEDGGDGNG